MHSQQGIDLYKKAVKDAVAQGGKIECGGKVSIMSLENNVITK